MELRKRLTVILLVLAAGYAFTGFVRINDPVRLTDADIRAAEEEAVGVWISNNGNEKFEIFRRDDKFYGKLIWMKHVAETGQQLFDINNPDPELRDRKVVGLELLYDFSYKGKGTYSNGKVYDPSSGNTYKCRIRVEGNTAKVRGYILVPLLGRTETAHRVFN